MSLLASFFVVSYAVAFAVAITQMFSRSALRGALVLVFTWAGFLLQTIFLYHRAVTANGTPLSSPFDWDLLGAWTLVAVYLYLAWNHPKIALGLFLLPLALGLIGLAHFADHEPFPHSEAGQVWGMIHGIFNLLGVVAVLVGFVAGMMYLIQSYRLKHKLPPAEQLTLPSLEWLERINSRAIVISVLMVGVGFVSGIILNVVLRHRQLDELPWSDPVVWRSALMFGWLLAAAVFSAVYRPARGGRKVAYLTVASFAFLVLLLGVRLLVPSEHGAMREGNQQSNAGNQWFTTHRLPPTACRLPLVPEVRA